MLPSVIGGGLTKFAFPRNAFVPGMSFAERHRRAGGLLHSITSSARASSEGGTVRPSVLAVWMLMTSSNLLDCTTGRSAGLGALEDAPSIDADLTPRIRNVGSVAHQSADFGNFACARCHREQVTRR